MATASLKGRLSSLMAHSQQSMRKSPVCLSKNVPSWGELGFGNNEAMEWADERIAEIGHLCAGAS